MKHRQFDGPKIETTRKPVLAATLSGVDGEWRAAEGVAARVAGYALSTVKNNLLALSQEGAVEMRYGARGRCEYRLPEASRG